MSCRLKIKCPKSPAQCLTHGRCSVNESYYYVSLSTELRYTCLIKVVSVWDLLGLQLAFITLSGFRDRLGNPSDHRAFH